MKKIMLAALSLLMGLSLSAQHNGNWQKSNQQYKYSKEDMQKFRENAMSRIRSEHIAYLTAELDLSPEEAQAFWPVYNKAAEEQRAEHMEFADAKRALKSAVKEGKSEKDVREALNTYLKAKASQHDIMGGYQKEFEKILGIEKTAKLYLAEDSFRTRQINKLGGGGQGKGGKAGMNSQNGKRPQGNQRQGQNRIVIRGED